MFGKRISFILLVAFALSLPSLGAYAAIKDSDIDGLTDEAEISTYLTDPTNYDTDGDGIADGYEITSGTNPLDLVSTPYPTVGKEIVKTESLSWYIGRASGILAFILFSIVIMNGLLMTTRLVVKLLPPALNLEMHKTLSWLGFGMTLLHIAALTFDKYFQLTWPEALIPFSLERSFLSVPGYDLTWTVGIGSIALYGIALLIITSQWRGKVTSMKAWRLIHYASFATYLLFLFHGIFSGSDTGTWWMTWIYVISAATVIALVIIRIYISVKKLSPKPAVAAPTQPTVPPAPPTA
jgi:cytochrome b561